MKMNKKARLKKTESTIVTKRWGYGPWSLFERFTDGELKEQYFYLNRWKLTHPLSYSPNKMSFEYLPNGITEPRVDIEDPENFTDFENCICYWEGMDGWNWRLNSKYPLPKSRTYTYIGGITNKDFDLEKVLKVISRKKYITDCEIKEIPYYNADEDRDKYIEFTVNFDDALIRTVFQEGGLGNAEFSYQGWLSEGNVDPLGMKKYYNPPKD